MLGCDSNFIKSKDFSLAIITEREAITELSFFSKDVNILLSTDIWLVHSLSSTQLVPPEEYAYKTN
jgi:hypothetical protein